MKKSYSSKFKSKVALEAIQGDSTIAEIAGKYQVHVNQVQQWEKRLMDGDDDIFVTAAERREKDHKLYTEDDLMKKIGRLEVENDFLRQVSLDSVNALTPQLGTTFPVIVGGLAE